MLINWGESEWWIKKIGRKEQIIHNWIWYIVKTAYWIQLRRTNEGSYKRL